MRQQGPRGAIVSRYARVIAEQAETALMRRLYASRILAGLILLAGFVIAQTLAQVHS